MKTLIELKRDYYSQPEMYFTPHMIDALVAKYGEKPATAGEASFIIRTRIVDILRSLPLVGRLF